MTTLMPSRIVLAKISAVLLLVGACYWLQASALVWVGLLVALQLVYALLQVAVATVGRPEALDSEQSPSAGALAGRTHARSER